MNSDRGWYLVAVGMLALGISNSSLGDSARGFFDRAAAVADHLSVETVRAFAVAQLMSDRGDPGWANARAAMAHAQARMTLAQARINARRAVLSEGRSNCAVSDRMHRAVVLSRQEDSD
ncbi:MAG: hypothetical protein DMG88_14185 [Acidobacteria bacterium]|nr:MAG: hypothetical protein DMG88_14185 [Acidobacteriota bacterium]